MPYLSVDQLLVTKRHVDCSQLLQECVFIKVGRLYAGFRQCLYVSYNSCIALSLIVYIRYFCERPFQPDHSLTIVGDHKRQWLNVCDKKSSPSAFVRNTTQRLLSGITQSTKHAPHLLTLANLQNLLRELFYIVRHGLCQLSARNARQHTYFTGLLFT